VKHDIKEHVGMSSGLLGSANVMQGEAAHPPFSDADEMGHGINNCTFAEVQWFYDAGQIMWRRARWGKREKRSQLTPWLGNMELTLQALQTAEQSKSQGGLVGQCRNGGTIDAALGWNEMLWPSCCHWSWANGKLLFTSRSIKKLWVALSCVKQHFAFGKVCSCQMRDDAQHKQWGRGHGNALINLAAGAAICKDAATKMAPVAAWCTGSSTPVLVLKSLMDRAVLKTFHAQAGASMDAWKGKRGSGSERLIWCILRPNRPEVKTSHRNNQKLGGCWFL
jgi:hypothetical protein